MSSVFRAHPLYINGKKVAEASDTTEDRTINAANQYGIDGVLGQSQGADETKIDFTMVIPVQGTEINIDDLLGVPLSLGVLRNGRLALVDGILMSSNYTSTSKDGTSTGKFSFIGGAAVFL